MDPLRLHHASWLTPFLRYFRKQKVDLTPYFKQSGVEPELAESGDGWIPKQRLYDFLNRVAEAEKMPELGFRVGDSFDAEDMGIIGDAMHGAETLSGAIQEFSRLINRRVEDNTCWLEPDPADAASVWLLNRTTNPFEANRSIADHCGLMILTQVVRLAAGTNWYPSQCRLQTEPTSAYQKVGGLKETVFEFNATETGLAFPSRLLLETLKDVTHHKASSPGTFDLLDKEESTPQKLKRLMHSLYGVGGMVPTLNMMSEFCDTRPRSLQRQIREEGESFHSLLNEVRVECAKERLKNPTLLVQEIANELGYSGANNFIRAFKRQTGFSPGEWRKQH